MIGATLIDGTGSPPIPDCVVLMREGRFVDVGRAGTATAPADWDVVDARGLWALPGLSDAHAHVAGLFENRFGVEDPTGLADQLLTHFCENGVTTVRCTGGPSLGPAFARLKHGEPHWPRFFGSGPNLDGPPGGPWPGLRVVTTPEEGRREAASLVAGGADFLKVYVWMTPEVMSAVCDTAHDLGVRVAAHVGHVVTAEEAVHRGVDALEHVRVGPELLTASQRAHLAALPARRNDHLISFRAWRYADPDSARAREVIELMASRGVMLTPTLCVSETVLRGNSASVRNPRGLSSMPPAVRERWEASVYSADYGSDDWATAEIELERQLAFVGAAHAGGVPIAAGTDTPNPFIVPGFSIHEELRLLSDAGIAPVDVVNSATLRVAQLLDREADLGSVTRGKAADLVLLGGDPLTRIEATTEIRAVFKDGRPVAGPSEGVGRRRVEAP